MYNSKTGANRDEDESTMIDQEYMYGKNDGSTSHSIVRRMQQAHQSVSAKCPKNKKSYEEKDAYVYVEPDRSEAAKQIEQVLNFYRQDLKHESNTQLDCNQRLITRLIDFLRPVFSSNERKMRDLDMLYEEISDSQDIRFIEQKEKIEQLNNEVAHLKKLIITSPHDTNRSNPMTKVYQINSMVNYDQWVELEEESKRLQQLVETQRNKINELVKLILPEGELSTDNRPPITTNSNYYSSGCTSNRSAKQNVFLQSVRTCPVCQAIFSVLSMDESQFEQHVKAHSDQKRR